MKLLENTRRYRKTKKGLLTNMYDQLKRRHETKFSLGEFHKRFLDDKKFNRLFKEWENNNYQKQFKPSLDRINNKGIYSTENTQMLNWAENRFKQSMERRCRKGAVAQMLGDKIVKIYKSQREASIKTGLSQGNLSEATNGKREFCGGYKWKFIYENPDLLTKLK